MVYHQQRGQCHAQNVGQRRADYRSRTLPRAIDVNAIDDCIVEGARHKNSNPLYC
jgi:hypothetical protein